MCERVRTRCIVKTSGFTMGVCKTGDFIKLGGFGCGIPREQALLRTSTPPPPKITRRVDFSEPRLLQCYFNRVDLSFCVFPCLQAINQGGLGGQNRDDLAVSRLP